MIFFPGGLRTVSIPPEIGTHYQKIRGERTCYLMPHDVRLRVAVQKKQRFSFSSPDGVYLDFGGLDFLLFEVFSEHVFVYSILTRRNCFPKSRGSEAMIEYKGYVAEVEFDDSVERFHGRVINSGSYPIASFEATDAEGVREEFRRSIDEYFASCEEDGSEPVKPFRIPT